MSKEKASRRQESLDGLRGVAAASVIFEHCMLVFPSLWLAFEARSIFKFSGDVWSSALTFTPLKIFWSGGAAVAIFFVLSGLVLSFPFSSGRSISFKVFALKRLVRLYPTYLVSLFISVFLFDFLGHLKRPEASVWFLKNWNDKIYLEDWVRAIFFLRSNFLQIDSPLWSLIHEMRVSLLFPVIIVALRRYPRVSLAVSFFISIFSINVPQLLHCRQADFVNVCETLSVVWLFVFGAFIGLNRSYFIEFFGKVSPSVMFVLVGCCLLLLTSSFTLPLPEVFGYFFTRLAAMVLIAIILANRGPAEFLSSKIPSFLGAISYPMYAIHFPILFATILATPNFPLWASIILGISLALVVSTIVYLTVERLALKGSRMLSAPQSARD